MAAFIRIVKHESRIMVVTVLFIALFIIHNSLFIIPAFAQGTALGVANSLVVLDKNISDGSIISGSNAGYVLSKVPYDPSMVGVVTKSPAIMVRTSQESAVPVSSSGTVLVNVSGQNGPIKKNDLITSSQIPGVGMKATETGFVLGGALEDFTPKNSTDQGKVMVSLNFRYAVSVKSTGRITKSLKDAFSLSAIAALERPSDVFKYVFSGFLVLVSIGLSILVFGREAGLGIEALGRNPRASMKITLGIIINVVICVAIIAGGLGVTYFILLSSSG